MRHSARSGLIKSFAIVLAMVGAMLFGAPQGAQAAPAMVSTEVAAPAVGLTQVQYGGHWRHHRRGFRHHHHRGRHFGHHHRRHFGHHYGHRRGHHFGHRRYRY
ncbi:hypothetical protein [Methylobacterium sp. Leaf117]|uniref:hypothetical protein n=1 Tax=Methylobacterium sp. Leaf117 TaxID=1736260 RepID=UPI0009EC7EA0|nr:hypothetical protein [Methylobacterium sp. Leaf117]